MAFIWWKLFLSWAEVPLLEKDYVAQMRQGLSGKSFSEMMNSLGFFKCYCDPLSLAEVHGNLHLSLGKIEEYLDNLAKVKKKLIEVATYPLILLGFLLLIMLGLRNYLLPQLDSSNIATQIIGNLPQIFLGLVLICYLSLLLALTFYKEVPRCGFLNVSTDSLSRNLCPDLSDGLLRA